jgi:hypothetical protein
MDTEAQGRDRMNPQATCRFVVAAFVVAVAGLLAAASASAAWTPYVNIANQPGVNGPLVEMDPAGNSVFMWMQTSDSGQAVVDTRVRAADGTLGPIQRIGSGWGQYDLAVDSQANAYYVWSDQNDSGDHLRTRVRSADGTLSAVQTLKTIPKGESIRGTVAVDASGTAVYAWDQRKDDQSDDLLQARTRSASGTLGPVRSIGTGYLLDWGEDANLAVDASGNTTFVWTMGATPDDGWIHVFTRVLTDDGSLGPVREVSRAGVGGTDPRVVVTPSGRALFGWSECTAHCSSVILLVRTRSADGDFGPRQVVTKTDDIAALPGLDLKMTPTGEAVMSWRTNHAWYARTRAPGGTLGTRKTISSTMPRDSDMDIDPQGNMVFAWTQFATADSKSRVLTRTESAGGVLSPTHVLSLANYNAYYPNVALSPTGVAAIGWQEGIHGFAIQASFGS